MPENLLKDPRTWAPAATSVAIMVSITLWVLSQRKKALGYQILWSNALVNLTAATRDRLEVRFDGQPVHDARLIMIKIHNHGHLPIKPADYAVPITVSVGTSAKILMAEVIDTHPEDLALTSSKDGEADSLLDRVDEHQVVLHPVLLNAKDSLTLQLLVSQMIGKVNVGGRIEGIHQIKETKETNFASMLFTHLGALFMGGALLALNPVHLAHPTLAGLLPNIFAFIFGAILLGSGLALRKTEIPQ